MGGAARDLHQVRPDANLVTNVDGGVLPFSQGLAIQVNRYGSAKIADEITAVAKFYGSMDPRDDLRGIMQNQSILLGATDISAHFVKFRKKRPGRRNAIATGDSNANCHYAVSTNPGFVRLRQITVVSAIRPRMPATRVPNSWRLSRHGYLIHPWMKNVFTDIRSLKIID
jgi:hypothetical protein